ncbi:MAG: outer membrane lipoprotein-sorting protein [Bacteroidota bacterium]
MRTIKILIILGLCSVSVFGQSDPKEIMKKSRDQAKIAGLETKTTLEINDGKGNKRIRETTMASRIFPDGTEKRVIVFLSPADVKGTSMLIYDYDKKADDMWIYMPALRKSRKIVSSDKTKSFMGSEFSNSDLSIGTIDDFTYTIEGTETVDQQECWKIRLTPLTPEIAAENGISYKLMWVCKKDYMPRKIQYFGTDGIPVKELAYSGIKLLDPKANKFYVTHMEMKNLKNNRFSVMNMDQVSVNPRVNEEYFTLSFIEKQ